MEAIQREVIAVGKGGLSPLPFRSANFKWTSNCSREGCEFLILSGGKPPFPTAITSR